MTSALDFIEEEGRLAMKKLLDNGLATRRSKGLGHDNMSAIVVSVDTLIKQQCEGEECEKYEKGLRGINVLMIVTVVITLLIIIGCLSFVFLRL